MVTTYRTRDGDMLDQICETFYGRASAFVEVLSANPGLAEYGPILPRGIDIVLPDLPTPVSEGTSLWS